MRFTASRLKRVPSNVKVVDYLPQIDVLGKMSPSLPGRHAYPIPCQSNWHILPSKFVGM